MSQRLEAYQEIMPKLPAKRAAVHAAISSQGEHGATLAELVGILGWPINRISGRVTELSRVGLLREAGIRGRQTVWAACLPQEAGPIKTKPKTIRALFEAAQDADLFGHMRITLTIPDDVPLSHLLPGTRVSLTISQEAV